MKIRNSLKLATMASLAVLTLAACSDTTISSPGVPDTPVSPPPPPPPPPPPASATIELVPTAGCPAGTAETTLSAIAADGFSDILVCSLGSGGKTIITSDVTIPADTTIAIRGPVFIGEDNKDDAGTPVTLTVGEGVRFFGASSTGTATATDDYMVISRGSKIEAIGSESKPIRFTSRAKLNDEETGSSITEESTTAQWGGLVINGFAPINACQDDAEGGTADCQKKGEGASGLFGGDKADDNSGTLRYVSVEYAGSRLTNEDELNGIAFQGVGSGTTVDHIQVHNNLDDSVEWFGGTVNVKYFVSTGAGDDNIDWTDGWTGKLQFAVVRSNIPSSEDPRGIEADNLDKFNDKTPFSNPSISNVTMVGSSLNHQGVLLRRGTKGRLVNLIVTGFPTGLDIDSAQTFANLDAGDLQLQSWFLDNTANFDTDEDPPPAFPASANIRTGNNTLVDGFFPGQQELAVPASTLLSGDSFFTQTDYIGAFSPSETVTSNWATFAQPGTLFPETEANCPAGTVQEGTLDGKKLCLISGVITNDIRLSNGDQLIYQLDGRVAIGVDEGSDPANPVPLSASATLTIDAGVTVVGEGNNDYLIITRGSKILSNGTATRPVVFTAKSKFSNPDAFDQDTKGIWGGVILNGRAPINACQDTADVGGTLACEKKGEGSSGLFGGASADDDSGQLFYTRVEYAGVRLTNEDELNGIAFQGVGSGTEVEYVQVYNNLDDCFEWFGGTVSAKHMLATGCGDDQFDWTDGWQGSLQYGIAYSGVGSATGGISEDSNGLEGDNLENHNDATPISTPRISNLTVIAGGDPNAQIGAKLRRGMQGTVANMIVLGWPDYGLDVDDTITIDNVNSGLLNIQSWFISGNGAAFASDGTEPDLFDNPTANNLVVDEPITMSGFTFRANRPGVVPGDNENAVPVFDVSGIGNLEATTYIGAVEDADDKWYLGWSIDQAGNLTSAD